jgi:hypothetical protein
MKITRHYTLKFLGKGKCRIIRESQHTFNWFERLLGLRDESYWESFHNYSGVGWINETDNIVCGDFKQYTFNQLYNFYIHSNVDEAIEFRTDSEEYKDYMRRKGI